MALEQQFVTIHGITLVNGYHKISWVQCSSPGISVEVQVSTYASEEQRRKGSSPLQIRNFIFPIGNITDSSLFSYLYERMKELPDFSSSTNC